MPMLNPFNVFSVSEIVDAINRLPNMYGRVGELGMFPNKSSAVRSVVVEERGGSIVLLPTSTVYGPGNAGSNAKRKVRTFTIPRMVYDEAILPEDVAGVRAFGGNEQANLAALLNDRLATARAKHEISLEYMRIGALKGTVVDGAGVTVYDYNSEFGYTQLTVDFVLGTSTTTVSSKCRAVVRYIEDNLMGDSLTGIRALVSPEFYDKLITHAKVEAAYANYASAADRIGGDLRGGFTFGGITFEEYRGAATDVNAATQRFIAAGDGYAFPVGTRQTFQTLVGPADFNESVGQLGTQYYAKVVEAKFGRGYEAHTQSNVLPINYRPNTCIRIFSSN